MKVNSILASSATTKEGNTYKKTRTGKISGAVGGKVLASAYSFLTIKAVNSPDFEAKLRDYADLCGKNFEQVKKTIPVKIALMAVSICAASFAIGAVVDAVVNKFRANAVDKSVKNAVKKLPE